MYIFFYVMRYLYINIHICANLKNHSFELCQLSMLIPNLNHWISPTCGDENQPIRLVYGWPPCSVDKRWRFACSAVGMMVRQHCCCENPPCKIKWMNFDVCCSKWRRSRVAAIFGYALGTLKNLGIPRNTPKNWLISWKCHIFQSFPLTW